MKKLSSLFKRTTGSHRYRPHFREYMERHYHQHGSQYVAIAVLLAASAIVLQAIWFMHSLIK